MQLQKYKNYYRYYKEKAYEVCNPLKMFSISFPALFVLIFLFYFFCYSHILALVHLDSQIPRGGVYLTFLYSCSTVRGGVWIG